VLALSTLKLVGLPTAEDRAAVLASPKLEALPEDCGTVELAASEIAPIVVVD